MPEYILWCKSIATGKEEAIKRFPEKDRKSAEEKALKFIDAAAATLTTEHRFELSELHFIPLPGDKWIINYEKKAPRPPLDAAIVSDIYTPPDPGDS